ncbi:hypothetical protein K431DRAFT_289269 [Polychaeton citri CBS 116435]|uniref:Uncharacterized protein n=1 Tax=Polychaeton citri CBS 116435 TaxID=1314669 RepID=A0A9P4UJQ2_9PEZI|nr:hypothetical protein K431DRAFT_289269 [Polychaeton citri CBS 116435]
MILAVSTTVCPVTLTSTRTSKFTTSDVLPPTSSLVGAVSAASEEASPSSYTENSNIGSALQTVTRTGTSTVTITSPSSTVATSVTTSDAVPPADSSATAVTPTSIEIPLPTSSSTDTGVATVESFTSSVTKTTSLEAHSTAESYSSDSTAFVVSDVPSSLPIGGNNVSIVK